MGPAAGNLSPHAVCMTRRITFKKFITALMCAALAAALAAAAGGCSAADLASEAAGAVNAANAAAGRDYMAPPVVNNAIYSNDYAVDEGPAKGGRVNVYSTQPDTYNPLLTRNMYAAAMLGLVYESLASAGPELAAAPRLAERWIPSADGLIWHIVLRGGVKWHDGRPLRARDVADTIGRIKEYGSESPYAGAVANIESATAMSELEVRVVIKKENAFTPDTLVFPIVPSHIAIGALDGMSGGANLGSALIGTGPFRYRNYENGARLVLMASDSWWGSAASIALGEDGAYAAVKGAGGREGISPPYLKDICFVFFDASEMALAQLRAGKVDLFFSKAFDYSRYASSTEFKIRRYSEREFLFLALNCAKGMTEAASVRRALSRMTDRQALIGDALGGRGMPAEFPVRPESELYNYGIIGTPFDVQAARSILESAGFRLDEGIFYGDVGAGWRKLEISLLVGENDAERCALADRIARMYYECGVAINVKREPAESVAAKVAGGDYEMALLSYRTPLYPDMTELYSTPWRIGKPEDGKPGDGKPGDGKPAANPARYASEEADRLSHALFSIYSAAERQIAFSELVSAVREDAPYIGICFKASSLVHGENLRGFIYPCAENPFNYMESWYLSDYR